MEKNKILATAFVLNAFAGLQAQVSVQNTGTLYISGAPDIMSVNGSFTNTAGAALTNKGNLYIMQNLVNDQAAMASGTGTLYLNGSTAQTVSGTQIFKTFNLVTNNAAGVTLNNDLSISGAHTFTAGIITTAATPNYLMYEAGASYSGDADSRHVNGWVRKTGGTGFVFPLGNGTVERTIATSSLSASSVFNAVYAGPTTNTSNVAAPLVTIDPNEYWVLNEASGGTAVVNMNWDNSKISMPAYALPDIRVANYIGGNWTQVGGTASGNVTTTGNIASNTLSTFGSFTLGSISLLLPVNLVQFYAYKSNGKAVLNWSTTDEINVSRYEVQRSEDGLQFYNIGNVVARNLSALQQYTFKDNKDINAAGAYYRLRSVDIDGKSKLSAIAFLGNNAQGGQLEVVNPVRGSIHVVSNLTGSYEYRINTQAGQTVQLGKLQLSGTATDIVLPVSFKKGLYILQINSGHSTVSKKILVQ